MLIEILPQSRYQLHIALKCIQPAFQLGAQIPQITICVVFTKTHSILSSLELLYSWGPLFYAYVILGLISILLLHLQLLRKSDLKKP